MVTTGLDLTFFIFLRHATDEEKQAICFQSDYLW